MNRGMLARRMARDVACACMGLTLALAAAGAFAQAFPARSVRVVVPYPPGGIGDTVTRTLTQSMGEALGQPFVIDNKPGASQMIGAELVARAPADGHTLFLGSVTSLAINVNSQKKLNYDPQKDFAPVGMAFYSPLYLVVNPAIAATSVRELIQLARAQPGRLSFASIGQGGSIHLAGELFRSMAGLDMVHVPYKGSAPALTDLIGGQVSLMFDAGVSALPQVRAGKLRALAVTSRTRSASAPELPTVAEAGALPGYEAIIWFALAAPAGTPREAILRLSQELSRATRMPGLRERFAPQGVEFAGGTPEELAEVIRSEIPKWGKVLKDANVAPE
ncbi:MAG: tripartite tricarboxylate transporter substrate binding protein [Burkholderiales bacterium]|nr:tripartite tricarboxylate transporter substrate binding protein [Burkholderiales bacterium]